MFIAVGFQLWAVSSNGADWSEFRIEIPADVVLADATRGGGQFVAVGDNSRIAFTYPANPDALAFTTAPGLNHLVGVTYGGGTFVAVGDRGIISSSVNGEDWTTRTNLQVTLTDVAFGAGRFVAVGPGNWIVTSTDGITWIPLNMPGFTNSYHVGVAYGFGKFVALGSQGLVHVSTYGAEWQVVDTGQPYLAGVAFGEGLFMAYGYDGIFSSTDGITWVRRSAWTNSPGYIGYPNRMAIGAGRVIHLAGSNRVYSSDPILRLDISNGPQLELQIWGMTGRSCRIESARSLEANAIWSPLGDVDLGAYPTTWVDPQPVAGNHGFYRAVFLPVP